MRDEATCALVPCMRALHDPALGLDDEAAGDCVRPQRLLRVAPRTGTAVARVANDLDTQPGVGRRDGLRALAAVGGIGVEPLESRHLGRGQGDHRRGGVTILHAGRCDGDGQQQPQVGSPRDQPPMKRLR